MLGIKMKVFVLWLVTLLSGFGQFSPPSVIYGNVRNDDSEVLDESSASIVLLAAGVEIGRSSLTKHPTRDENYRIEIPLPTGSAPYTVKIERGGVQRDLLEASPGAFTFTPVPGEVTRYDFIEEVNLDPDGPPDGGEVVSVIYGNVRDDDSSVLDEASASIVLFAEGVEIGRSSLAKHPTRDENYRIQIPLPTRSAPYTVKIERGGVQRDLMEASPGAFAFTPVAAEVTRYDFIEEVNLDPEGPPDGGGLVSVIYGNVRDEDSNVLDEASASIVLFADGTEIGRSSLMKHPIRNENYRIEVPLPTGSAPYTVKIERGDVQGDLLEAGPGAFTFTPVPGEVTRYDFIEDVNLDPEGPPLVGGLVSVIYGTVRDDTANPLDEASASIVLFAEGVVIGRSPLVKHPTRDENYRIEISLPTLNPPYTVRIEREDSQGNLREASNGSFAFTPVAGEVTRYDFIDETDLDSGGLLDNGGLVSIIYGKVRDEDGNVIDDASASIILFANGLEIKRSALVTHPTRDENYRIEIPKFSIASRATHTVKMIKGGQLLSIFDSCYGFRVSRPILGELRRLDFLEMADLNLNGVPDEVEIEGGSLNGDFDFDGLKDFQEAAIGTDPRDPESGLNFKVVGELPNGDVEIAYDVVSGHTYTLEVSNDAYDWAEVSSFTATAAARRTMTATPIAGESVFWRVGVE